MADTFIVNLNSENSELLDALEELFLNNKIKIDKNAIYIDFSKINGDYNDVLINILNNIDIDNKTVYIRSFKDCSDCTKILEKTEFYPLFIENIDNRDNIIWMFISK